MNLPDQPVDGQFDKHIRNAHIFLRREDYDSAENSCRAAMEHEPEGSVAGLELLGDIQVARGETQVAMETYRRCMEISPQAASPEEKYARLVLNLSSEKEANPSIDDLLESTASAKPAGKNPSIAFLSSLFWPGLGQWYNGEITKATILALAYGFSLLILIVTGDLSRIIGAFITVMAPAQASGVAENPGLLSSMVWFVAFAVWLYGIIDAPTRAGRNKKADSSYTEPS